MFDAFQQIRQGAAAAAATQLARMPIRERFQLTECLVKENSTWRDLPRVNLQGVDYIAHSHLVNTAVSGILDHGAYIIPISEQRNEDGTTTLVKGSKSWYCYVCDQRGISKILDATATSSVTYHLKKKHPEVVINRRGPLSLSNSSRGSSPGDDTEGTHTPSVIQQVQQHAKRQPVQNTLDNFKHRMIELVTVCDIPPSTCVRDQFRELLGFFNRNLVAELLRDSQSTILAWVEEAFKSARPAIIRQLRDDAISKIHLSFDMWDSPSKKGVLGIVAHFVDRQWKLRTRLIALRRVAGSHTAENMVEHLNKVVELFDIQDKLGFFTLDNASG